MMDDDLGKLQGEQKHLMQMRKELGLDNLKKRRSKKAAR